MEQLNYCKIEHGWKTRDVSNIDQVVVYRAESSDESPTLPERGITMYPPENDEVESDEQMQCSFVFTCVNPPHNLSIAAIDVISSAKAMEVYTDKRDYIETVGGMRLNIEAENGNRVFLVQHSFEPPLSACMLKFVSRHRKEELYLHSIQISLVEATAPTSNSYVGINMPEVRNMLGQNDTQMSDNAQALFTAMEAYQKNKSSTGAMFGGMMGSMMSQMGPSGNTNAGPNMAAMAGMFASMGMGRNAATYRVPSISRNNDDHIVMETNNDTNSSSHSSNSTESNLPQNVALNGESGNLLPMLLPQLTQLFETKLLEMEQRICSKISKDISLSEQRLTRLILERTGSAGNDNMNQAELDLD